MGLDLARASDPAAASEIALNPWPERLPRWRTALLDRLVTAEVGHPVRIVARIEDVRTGAVADEARLTT